VHPLSAPSLPGLDDIESHRVVLRDGSVASIRPTTVEDAAVLADFFAQLSPVSRYQRFFSAGGPPDDLVLRLSDSSDPSTTLTLVAERANGIIATASYIALSRDSAEAAFAVSDAFQGRGLATALLSRLAAAASARGFRRFEATTLSENARMLEVFRDSGFEIRSKRDGGCVDVTLSLAPSATGSERDDERRRIATVASLRPLLEPQAVAVVGASRRPTSIGRRVLDAIVAAGFNGAIYPVNTRADEIAGLKAYASARDLPAGVDLAVIAVPAPAVLDVVDDCAAAGIKSLVVITAGFAEAGAEGWAAQEALTDKVRKHGMRMVGPNCMGIFNTKPSVRLNASFSPIFPPAGRLGLLSQSGALGIAIVQLAAERRLGLSTFVSAGNKADVSGNDLLEYWESDPSTSVLLLYLESFGNPRRFARLARRISRKKPIVVVKSGRTGSGSRAASSHTAAMAANDTTVDALFAQSGVIRADTIDEMFDIASCLDLQPLPPGRRVAILTNAGGPGILAADACEAAGLTLTPFSTETRNTLATALPAMASVGNPIDMIASAGPDQYAQAIRTLMTAPEIDSLIVLFTPVDLTTAPAIMKSIRDGVAAGRQAGATKKPVLSCVMAEPGRPAPLDADGERLPAFAFPENAARALGRVSAYAEWRAQPPALYWGFDDADGDAARAICRDAAERGAGWLSDDEVQRVLAAYKLPVATSVVTRSVEEAMAAARQIGFPVALKISSPAVTHKTDVGGVRLNLEDEASVRQAFSDVTANAPDARVLVQQMVTGGVETMMGIVQDRLFGPLVAFGLGGIHVEILKDVRVRLAPLSDHDVDDLLHGIKGFPLLQGYRGHAPADLTALRDTLLRLSRMADEIPEITELDLNPVMALAPGEGCRIVDARIRVEAAARPFERRRSGNHA
jgi:acetyl coenzyme A synthetase (ADP forming)-like protein